MLTPLFDLSQTEEELVININVPYAKVSETDIHFEDYQFMFYCKPYYLRLTLPGKVLYAIEPKITYDVSVGTFTIHMIKATRGENFPNLDFVTKFLAPKRTLSSATPKIEVIDEGTSTSKNDDQDDNEEDDDDIDLGYDLILPDEEEFEFGDERCGFANKYQCTVFRLKDEASVIFDITDPHRKPQSERYEERRKDEHKKFSDDHYLADLYEDESIKPFIAFETEWDTLYQYQKDEEAQIKFTSEEKDRLVHLPNKEFMLTKIELKRVYLSLVDILFAFAYNKRTTLGENTVESGWTINKLSASLSWLDTFPALSNAACSAVQRSLIYPLYRNWDLAMKVLEDVSKILTLGRKYILKCFLEIYSIFCVCDPRYILNDLFITDYCIWIQGKSCSSSTIKKLADSLRELHLRKSYVGLDLNELEYAAKLVLEESSYASVDKICAKVATMNIRRNIPPETDSDDDTSTDSDDDSSTDSDDSSSDDDDSSGDDKSS